MKPASFVSLVCLVAALNGGVAGAQELDAKWVVGKWSSSLENPGDRRHTDQWQLFLRQDGTFEGDIQSTRAGLIRLRNGSWKIDDQTVVLEALHQGGPSHVNGTKLKLTLRRAGDKLDGTGYKAFNNETFPASFTRSP